MDRRYICIPRQNVVSLTTFKIIFPPLGIGAKKCAKTNDMNLIYVQAKKLQTEKCRLQPTTTSDLALIKRNIL